MTTLKSILEIDPSIIRSNIQKLKNKTSNTSNLLAVIKSDAYGHMLNNIVSDTTYFGRKVETNTFFVLVGCKVFQMSGQHIKKL